MDLIRRLLVGGLLGLLIPVGFFWYELAHYTGPELGPSGQPVMMCFMSATLGAFLLVALGVFRGGRS